MDVMAYLLSFSDTVHEYLQNLQVRTKNCYTSIMVTNDMPVQPNILNPNCGSRQVLDVIADKWTMITVYVLARGTRRFGQLQREIGEIS